MSKATDIRLIDRWFSCTEPNGDKLMPGKESKPRCQRGQDGGKLSRKHGKSSAGIEWNGEHLWLG